MPRNPSNNSSTLGTEVSIHGSCKGTRGRGGWAAVISDQEQRQILSGNDRITTAQRMTLLAAIKGIESINPKIPTVLYSNDRYLLNAMRNATSRTANKDLWDRLQNLLEHRNVRYQLVSPPRRSPGIDIAKRIANMEANIYTIEQTSRPNTNNGNRSKLPRRPKRSTKR